MPEQTTEVALNSDSQPYPERREPRVYTDQEQALRDALPSFLPTIQAQLMHFGIRSSHDCEDLAQSILLHAWEKLDQLRNPAALSGWLWAITHRMAINFIARSKERSRGGNATDLLQNTVADHSEACDPVMKASLLEGRGIVREGLERLSVFDRHSLEEFHLRGKSLIQMQSDDPNHPPIGTLKRRLHVARNRLKKVLEDLVSDPEELVA